MGNVTKLDITGGKKPKKKFLADPLLTQKLEETKKAQEDETRLKQLIAIGDENQIAEYKKIQEDQRRLEGARFAKVMVVGTIPQSILDEETQLAERKQKLLKALEKKNETWDQDIMQKLTKQFEKEQAEKAAREKAAKAQQPATKVTIPSHPELTTPTMKPKASKGGAATSPLSQRRSSHQH